MSKSPLWLILLVLLLPGLACNLPMPPAATPAPAASQDASTPFQPQPVMPTTPPSLPSPAAENPAAGGPTALPPVEYQPVFEPGACPFTLPPGYNPDCGYLIVPENRARPGSPSIRLPVAIFRSLSASPAPDPVIHLAGGPGSSALEVAGYMFRQGLGTALNDRDLILFDQRGTGYAQPRLDCPEREMLAPVLLEGHLPPNESSEAILAAFRRCRERLAAQGIDLSAYNSAASAADVEDLRRALGLGQVNLYGISYGTRLALTILRDYPAGVRSAVLDSTYPLQVNLYTALAPNAERAFNRLFEGCAADPDCAAAYPDLRGVFYRLVDDLDANPLSVPLQTQSGPAAVRVDGGLLIDVLFVGLYNPAVAATMPAMIYAIRQGNTTRLRERLLLYFDASTAIGMQMSVQCAEEIPFDEPADAAAAAQNVEPHIADFFPASIEPLFAACQEWNTAPPNPRENQPVAGGAPVLILAGEYDPITPPDWGRMAAGDLSNAAFFEFPGHGHWVTRSSDCALALTAAFWQDPTRPPDAACLQYEAGLEFE